MSGPADLRSEESGICVIFDLDGTLVDSESLCNQAFLDLLPGLGEPLDQLVERYRGLKLSLILSDLEHRLGEKLPHGFEAAYRERVSDLFEHGLKPVQGVGAMLDQLSHPKCIASSGPRGKIEQSLRVSGLSSYFGSDVFSSYEVGSWKPDPELFLHAARQMGFSPDRCVVVEDSAAGIRAAKNAGMTSAHYTPGNRSPAEEATVSFRHMTQLPDVLSLIMDQS